MVHGTWTVVVGGLNYNRDLTLAQNLGQRPKALAFSHDAFSGLGRLRKAWKGFVESEKHSSLTTTGSIAALALGIGPFPALPARPVRHRITKNKHH